MNKENLAKAIVNSIREQTGVFYIHNEEDLRNTFLNGPVDLIQLADSLLAYLKLKGEQPLSIAGIESCVSTPIVKIVWGDGVVTYAHFTQEAEVVHMMGRETVPKRFGAMTPEEAMAS